MIDQSQLNHESSAVQKHLEIMQGVIFRMAENSRSCKVWCVTLVSAILVLVARTGGGGPFTDRVSPYGPVLRFGCILPVARTWFPAFIRQIRSHNS